MCKTFKKFPHELELDEINPIELAWLQYQFSQDYQEQWKLLENSSYLLASFDHPDAVQKILGKDGQTFASTDEEFEQTLQKIRNLPLKSEQNELVPKRRRRKFTNKTTI